MENIHDVVLAKIANTTVSVPKADPVEKHIALASEAFEMFQIDGSYAEEGVRTNVQEWWDNKQSLINFFRQHPYWNEDAKAILFVQNEIRPISFERARAELSELKNYIEYKLNLSYECDRMLNRLNRTISRCKVVVINQEFIDSFDDGNLPKHIKSKLRVGVKVTKFVNAVFSELEDENGNTINATRVVDEHDSDDRSYRSYDKFFAKFADCLNELHVKKITVISVNFNDFLTMSNGNSWSSCHFINSHGIFHEDAETSYHGMYKQGCLSYALDNCSFIFYTLPSNYMGNEYWKQQKLNRMVCQYGNGIMVCGKLYPNNEKEISDNYRHIIQQIISECEGFSNSWSFTRKISRIKEFTETADNSGHYPDYTYEHQNPVACIHKPFLLDDIDETPKLTIGHEAYCVHCGDTLSGGDHDWLQCNIHRIKRICQNCGRIIGDYEELIKIKGEPYCTDCTFYCAYHHEYEVGDYIDVEIEGNTETVCEYGYGRRYVICDECGETIYRSRTTPIDGKYICRKCLRVHYYECPNCGQYHKNGTGCTMQFEVEIDKNAELHSGDYVVMADREHILHCRHTATIEMKRCYPNRIVRINHICGDVIHISNLDDHNWNWDKVCFLGVITSEVTEDNIGSIAIVKEAE